MTKRCAELKSERERLALKLNGIESFFEAGRPVKRLTKRISCLELKSMRESLFEHCLQGVVSGSCDGVFGENVGEDGVAVGWAIRPAFGPNRTQLATEYGRSPTRLTESGAPSGKGSPVMTCAVRQVEGLHRGAGELVSTVFERGPQVPAPSTY